VAAFRSKVGLMNEPVSRAKPGRVAQPRRAARRLRLDRPAVVRAAGELADEHGSIERLQLAELATRLAIRTPSLYAHVGSLDDLRRAIALDGLRDLRERMTQAASGNRGADALLSIARGVRAYALERPGLYTAAALPPRDRDWEAALLRLKDVFLTVLSRYGISGEDATDCIRSLRSAIHGFIVLEAQGDFGQPDPAASFERLVSVVLKGMLDDAPSTGGKSRTARARRSGS
jgi:AcrR family transcriptional regulator